MRLAAIDIGSNAVRLLVEEIYQHEKGVVVNKIALTRVPIRLGDDVFSSGSISLPKVNQLTRTMSAFWQLMDVYGVKDYRACATSAMREAKNGKDICKIIRNQTGIDIEIIDGSIEADLIFGNFINQDIDRSGHYLYIDVGGGSTELTLIRKGKRITSKSFKIGTVRWLNKAPSDSMWKEIKTFIGKIDKSEQLTGIGTGGNINRIFKEAGKKRHDILSLDEITATYDHINKSTIQERIVKLGMKPDRADVIVPAAKIYIKVMKIAGINKMLVPKVGLADGIILDLHKEIAK